MMNIVLWVLQGLMAAHTLMGAWWKVSHSEQMVVPSLKVIPHKVWLAMMAVEAVCAVGLVLPAVYHPAAMLVPLAALVIGAEMLAFCGLHAASGDKNRGPMLYWLVVAAVCAVIAYGRLVLLPL